MPVAESRARAEQVFVMREVGMASWPKIRDALGFTSVGGAQLAYKRYVTRERKHRSPEAAVAGIEARRRKSIGLAFKSLAEAQLAGDHQAVARLLDSIVKADADMAKMYGLYAPEQVDVTVSTDPAAVLADTRRRLIEVIDAETVETKELER